MRQVLVIEDSRDIAELLSLHLGDMGCSADWAADGPAGLELAARRRYDLIILDIMLPRLDGLEVCRRIRAGPGYTPVLMLTARSTELDRVLGLELGADDYITKPFSIRELIARVKAIFRRVDAMAAPRDAAPRPRLCIRDIAIDLDGRAVSVAGSQVELTAKEFDLLAEFATNPGVVFTRAELLDRVWHTGHLGYEHTVNSHINRLRAKIERDPRQPTYILTVWGVGYKFAAEAEP
ncbi:MAG: response regulator transcription factor [Alphaproteobacteria bacterium]